jgi:hypothetical protein
MRQLVPSAALLVLSACGALDAVSPDHDGPSSNDGVVVVGGVGGNSGTSGGGGASGNGGIGGTSGGIGGAAGTPPIETCFARGTPIATPDGERPIETLQVGDVVWAFDVAQQERVQRRVSEVHRHEASALGRLITPDGRALLVTDKHPIYVQERAAFVPAGELDTGETVIGLDAADQLIAAPMQALVPDVAYEPVYNITVEVTHTYFAAGLLVHNKSPPPVSCPNPSDSPYHGFCDPWRDTCFAPGTMIATPSGERAIESLQVGDAVLAYDTARGVPVTSRVTATFAHEPQAVGALALANGQTLYVTDNHPFYDATADSYVPAGTLTAESALVALDGTSVVATHASAAFAASATYSPVHNITVDGVHNYFAGGVLVHNKEAPPCPSYDWSTGEGCDHPVVGMGPMCEPYPSAALSAQAYVARINDYLFAIHDPSATPTSLPTDAISDLSQLGITNRNVTLKSLIDIPAAFEIGSVLAGWLRVPAPAAPSASGTEDEQVYWQLASDLGTLTSRLEGATLAELLSYAMGSVVPPEPAGLLTEAAFLRAHPTPSDRGRVLDELFLCGSWTEHLPPMLPPLQLGSRYDAYAQLSTSPACSDCHLELDPIGLTLEQFDERGAFRPVDAGQDVVPQGVIRDQTVLGPAGLATLLTSQPMIEDCLARSLLADALDRPLTPLDECSVTWVVAGMQGRADVRGALLSVITSPAFMHEAPH